MPKQPPKVKIVRCEVLMPHVREIDGQTKMFDPAINKIVDVSFDENTKHWIKMGCLELCDKSGKTEGETDAASEVRTPTKD